MANNQIKFITSFLLLSLAYSSISTTANASEHALPKPVDKQIDVVVEGMVYCQNCLRNGSWSLTGAKPMSRATISVICKHGNNRISFYKAFKTDPAGYFYAKLDGFEMRNSFLDHPLQACRVKLVASPLSNCNLFTNINYGLSGAALRYEDKRLLRSTYEAVIYAAGPLAFRPTHCLPQTSV